MSQPSRRLWFWLAPFIGAAVAGAVIWISTTYLVDYGLLGMVVSPVLMGFVCASLLRLDARRSYTYCFGNACLSLLVLAMGLILFGMEGLICLIMVLPLSLLPLMLGVAVAFYLFHGSNQAGRVVSLVVFAVTVVLSALDVGAQGSVAEAKTSIEITGTPEEVWEAVIGLTDLPEPRDWVLRSGLACPVSTRLEGTGVGSTRLCLLSTGPMPERITVWEPQRRLGFLALSTPPPLREINPLHEVHPPHLVGHYRVLYGEFEIEDLGSGRCRLTRLTRFENRIRPAFYWNLWCNLAADRAHRHVLEAVRDAVRTARVSRAAS